MPSAELVAEAPEDTAMDTVLGHTVVAIIMIVIGAWVCRQATRPVTTPFSFIARGFGGMIVLFGVLKLGFVVFG